jgi:hypothetical protein
MHRRDTAYNVAFFVALLATALALGAALAHALELPIKMTLSRDEYFVVQKIYAGWDRLAYLLLVELLAILSVILLSGREPRVFALSVLALICLLAVQAVFWTFTFPANVATQNWTHVPAGWETLRRNWEYSHAAGAAFQTLAMASLIGAVLARHSPHKDEGRA